LDFEYLQTQILNDSYLPFKLLKIATKTNMWDATIGDFKNIYDYNVRIGHNAYY